MPRPVAVITGASSGIGAVFARRLAETHNLFLVARRADRLEALAAELKTSVEIASVDLGERDQISLLAERVASLPGLGLLVNNAGFGVKGKLWETSMREQQEMIDVHITATLRLTDAALRNLVPRATGGIINVASVAAFVRGPGSSTYCASKSWITAFTEGVHLELQSSGSPVKVQALCPGYTYSEFHDRLGVDRERVAPRWLWTTAEKVVDDSLRGLDEGKLFVIPGWPYRMVQALVTRVPTSLRLKIERGPRSRREQMIRADS